MLKKVNSPGLYGNIVAYASDIEMTGHHNRKNTYAQDNYLI